MSKLVVKAMGGMIPILDKRLLPETNAQEAINTWLYSGCVKGFRALQDLHTLANPNARTVFRVPKGRTSIDAVAESFWLEFEVADTTVVRSPNTDVDDPRYYWADGIHPPGYTTFSRIEAGDPPLVLGIPGPSDAPVVTTTSGTDPITESRTYVYTWVSQYFEEGPPSPPSAVVTDTVDSVWHIALTAPTPSDLDQRALAFTNIYRTVTAQDGTAQYYFVAQIDITTLTYDDTASSNEIVLNNPLQSIYWTAPPANLKGLCSLPNGMIAGWVGQELWYCEPFRPHAWPVPYQTSVDFPIVGMAALDQMLVIGTQNVAYSASGVDPSSVSLRIITGSEPCMSQNSFVVTPNGVVYAGPNGLMNCTIAGAVNITRGFISTDRWQELLNIRQLNAALMNGAYYCFSGVVEEVFQRGAFQLDAFQIETPAVSRDGALIELSDQRVGYTILRDVDPTFKVIQDVWTAEVLLIRSGKVWLQSLVLGERESYSWTSKVFQLTMPQNYGAMKIVCDKEPADGMITMEYYANDQLRLSRPVPLGSKPFRLPSGYKVDSFQIRIFGNVGFDQIEIASTERELASI